MLKERTGRFFTINTAEFNSLSDPGPKDLAVDLDAAAGIKNPVLLIIDSTRAAVVEKCCAKRGCHLPGVADCGGCGEKAA